MRHVPLRRPKADTKGRLKNGIPPFSDGLCASSGIIKAGIFRIGSSGFVSQGTGYFLVSVKPVQPNNSVSTRHR